MSKGTQTKSEGTKGTQATPAKKGFVIPKNAEETLCKEYNIKAEKFQPELKAMFQAAIDCLPEGYWNFGKEFKEGLAGHIAVGESFLSLQQGGKTLCIFQKEDASFSCLVLRCKRKEHALDKGGKSHWYEIEGDSPQTYSWQSVGEISMEKYDITSKIFSENEKGEIEEKISKALLTCKELENVSQYNYPSVLKQVKFGKQPEKTIKSEKLQSGFKPVEKGKLQSFLAGLKKSEVKK